MKQRIYTARETGEILGVTEQGIRKWCARNDVPRAGRTWQISESTLAQMRAYYHATDAPDELKQQQPGEQTNETIVEPSIPERDTLEEDNARLQEQVKTLTAQLEAKDKQIQSLTDNLSKSIEQNSALTASLAETAKALATSKAFENASKALVANDAQTLDMSHYNGSDGQQKPGTFFSRLKWLIWG